MPEYAGFSMKDFLSAPGLGWKFFKSLITEEDEPIYAYNDNYMRHLVKRTKKEDASVASTNIINLKILAMF